MTTTEAWMLGCTILMAMASIGALIVAILALNRRQQIAVQQPVDIKLIEQLVSKDDFMAHVRENDRQRGLLHKRLDDAIKDYNEKFQALPNEIVALLRNTGNLR
jgi:uncharacterized protein YpmS